jgi:hypothetical protein
MVEDNNFSIFCTGNMGFDYLLYFGIVDGFDFFFVFVVGVLETSRRDIEVVGLLVEGKGAFVSAEVTDKNRGHGLAEVGVRGGVGGDVVGGSGTIGGWGVEG